MGVKDKMVEQWREITTTFDCTNVSSTVSVFEYLFFDRFLLLFLLLTLIFTFTLYLVKIGF